MLSAHIHVIKYEQKNVTNILRRRGVPSHVASLRGFKSAEEGRYDINPKKGKRLRKIWKNNAVDHGSSSAGGGIISLRERE